MSGSFIGQILKVSTFGESHGKAIGAVIDGCPAGLKIYKHEIQKYLKRRAPISEFSTTRIEPDNIKILSGILNNITLGTPICICVENKNFKSKDYDDLKNVFRPGHADYAYQKKFGVRDDRGGGRSSGRETVARVIAGYIAKKFLSELNIKIAAYTFSVGKISVKELNPDLFDFDNPEENFLFMPDDLAFKKAVEFIKNHPQNNSIGGVVECRVKNIKAGIGEPVFDKLDAQISKAVMSIGAVKGIEFGSGFKSSYILGSQNNDEYYFDNNIIKKRSNNSGGITGGITDGGDIVFRVAIKPTPSISKQQSTVDTSNKNIKIKINGRHDKLIVPRVVVVIESMTALAVADQILLSCTSKLNDIKKIYFRR